MENVTEVRQKIRNRTTTASNSTPEYIFEKDQNTNLKRYMHPNIHNIIICSIQDMEAT